MVALAPMTPESWEEWRVASICRYAADMALWLWTMAADERAMGRVYNVGSEQAMTIAETAHLVAQAAGPGISVTVAQPPAGETGDAYVPSTARARRDLGLRQVVGLEEALRRTLAWHRSGGACADAT